MNQRVHTRWGITLTIFSLLSSHSLFSQEVMLNDVKYTLSGDTAVVTGRSVNLSGALILPATLAVDGTAYRVTAIDDYVFRYCDALTAIELPEGLTSIGKESFGGCSSLKEITLPEELTSFKRWVFTDCAALKEIHLVSTTPIAINREVFIHSWGETRA